MEKVNEITLPAQYTSRPAERADARAIHAIFVAADLADGTSRAGSWEEYENELTASNFHPETDSQLVLSPDGTVIGGGWFTENQSNHVDHYAAFFATVHPGYRGKGIGTWLMSWFEEQAGKKLAAYGDGLPCWLSNHCWEGQGNLEALLSDFDYRPVRSYFKMRRDIRGHIEAPHLPEGMSFVPYEASLDSQFHSLMDTAFQDHFLYQPHTPESWALHTSRSVSFCPRASTLVIKGQEAVGASVCSIWAEDNARLGIQEGWVEMLGVLSEYRKQGIASSLLYRAMQVFREMGMDYTGLFVDAENETGALGLYERLGFRKVTASIRWVKHLS